ncbi:flavin reductase (DIM6/NTAB) family NADH-FMN oxidoreductase RutF [Amycolatopsis sulphurea]|uniref:Flavin reductase (DIM6/NTAB) family NADH-FMN oxidoreductase RutF n=1 Tax=Amycolatopsis sulphurea TaxID=76022 RepID=A0A2A9FCV6_9PSEU|nr:flavin reductase family protein [Amycolatopsis sulphurea]PFG49194.1 flavin reductase (DIM6/NTAB) family NADH-FMN oxidoreductase RutF [Amycolatopsis sulphurea]
MNAAAAKRPLDARSLRGCLGQFATGVAVVTYDTDDGPRGATINSFTSVSMDPPLVLVSFARHTTAARLLGDRPFVVNVLAANQLDVALQFAGRPQEGLEVPWSPTAEVPRLRGTVAWLQCTPWATQDGGDHLLFLGEVVHHDSCRGDPLLFHKGQFRMAGVAVYDLPRVVQLDGRPLAPWVGHAHRLHEITEPGYLDEP